MSIQGSTKSKKHKQDEINNNIQNKYREIENQVKSINCK